MRRRVVLVFLLAVSSALPSSADPVVAIGDLRSPESAAWHASSASWFISNMGGASFDLGPDAGKGFVSKVAADGTTTRWATGLERPRGIAVGPTNLFVAERTGVAVLDLGTGALVKRISVPGGNGDLNDIAFDATANELFVSAPSVDAIFRIRAPHSAAAAVDVFVQSTALTQPNGILIESGRLVVVGLGLATPTGVFGRVVAVDRGNRRVTAITQTGLGLLDGIVADGADYLVTEYLTGNLYRVAIDGTVGLEMKLAPGSADIGIDPARRIIGVPQTLANAAVFVALL